MNFQHYQSQPFFDELFDCHQQPRSKIAPLIELIDSCELDTLQQKQAAAEAALKQMGITFNLASEEQEQIFPFDIIPRVILQQEWQHVERGLKQRVTALNLFLQDIYHEAHIVHDKFIPQHLIESASGYLKQCQGFTPAKQCWIPISGIDLVRDIKGDFYVLEDNCRCPSGISYVLENRAILKRTFPEVFSKMQIQPVSDYGDHLYDTLSYCAPVNASKPNIVVLTPGPYNAAYFEHAFLAQQMGVPLVQGSDLTVIDDYVMLRTTEGFEKVDMIYRRIDDEYLDPQFFREGSMLGVPGLMQCYQQGNVSLANAPGTGVADDKAIYAFVPQMIRYYLDQEPILPNVETFLCDDSLQRDYVLRNLDKLVVKTVNLSGGYGMLIGPKSTKAEREAMAAKIKANPRDFIAQPTLDLSTCPTIIGEGIASRHVDIRPYVLFGESIYVTPGGLTRVALKENSLVVNSSQGGGSKDTWVIT